MSAITKKCIEVGSVPLCNAIFCLDCEVITNCQGDECPVCNRRSLVSLARILGGSLYAHQEQQSQEGESKFFDITITVELKQMCAKELTSTLERLTTVIGPKLARDQAILHTTVKPSEDSLKSQNLLCLPERDVA